MTIDVILPALGMSQETGKIVRWLKAEGERVAQGEPLAEIETDKATVELEAAVDGMLASITAVAGDEVPVGQVIAHILTADDASIMDGARREALRVAQPFRLDASGAAHVSLQEHPALLPGSRSVLAVSSLAARIATDHNVDLSQVKASGRRIQKADVLQYLQSQQRAPRLVMASPKARRLAAEAGKDLHEIKGSGPGGAVLAADVLAAEAQIPVLQEETSVFVVPAEAVVGATNGSATPTMSTIWRIMAEHTTQSWTSVPHFSLVREVNAIRLISWREQITKQIATKVTYTDLLVKIVSAALRRHPRLNATWNADKISMQPEIHIGLAVAVEDGLVVPVIHRADTLDLNALAQQRIGLIAKAHAGKLRPQDIKGGTFTISNLGMYGVDAFNAIINQPQAAILAIGRIAERVVPMHGRPVVQPMMVITLSCDHRVVDGAHGARFLESIATLIEEPLGLLA